MIYNNTKKILNILLFAIFILLKVSIESLIKQFNADLLRQILSQ